MGNELVATYYIFGEKYNVFGCWDNETEENTFDFFDVYDSVGTCINEGEPFWKEPTRESLKEYIKK